MRSARQVQFRLEQLEGFWSSASRLEIAKHLDVRKHIATLTSADHHSSAIRDPARYELSTTSLN